MPHAEIAIFTGNHRLAERMTDIAARNGAQVARSESVDELIYHIQCGSVPLVILDLDETAAANAVEQVRSVIPTQIAVGVPSRDGSVFVPMEEVGVDGLLRLPLDEVDLGMWLRLGRRFMHRDETAAPSHGEGSRTWLSALVEARDSDECARLLMEALVEHCDGNGGIAWLPDEDEIDFRTVGAIGVPAEIVPSRVAAWTVGGLTRPSTEAGPIAAFRVEAGSSILVDRIIEALGTPEAEIVRIEVDSGLAILIALFGGNAPSGEMPEEVRVLCRQGGRLIGERILSERSLADARRVEELDGELPAPLMLVDRRGNILRANPALAEQSGYAVDDLLLMRVHDLLGPQANTSKLKDCLGLATGTGLPGWPADLDGSLRPHSGPNMPITMKVWPSRLIDPDAGQLVNVMIVPAPPEVTRTERVAPSISSVVDGLAHAATAAERVQQFVEWVVTESQLEDAGVWVGDDSGELRFLAQTSPEVGVQLADLARGAAATSEIQVFSLDNDGESGRTAAAMPLVRNGRISGVLAVSGAASSVSTFLEGDSLPVLRSVLLLLIDSASAPPDRIDATTGLPDRRAFRDRFAARVGDLPAEPMSILMVGIDRFKKVNDTYGHLVGDELLAQVASTLRDQTPDGAFVARFASDEFVIGYPAVTRERIYSVAESVRIAVATRLYTADDQLEQLTVSIGAATFPDDAENVDRLMLATGHAMRLAKQAGRNQVYQSNAAFSQLAAHHGRLTDLLRQAPRETLALLVKAMDQRMPERAGHAQRVARYSVAIAEELGLSQARIAALRVAAMVHDIGMFGLPDSVLRKPIHLSDGERRLLDRIPEMAQRLLSQIDLPMTVVPGVVHQHEHWDGNGRPAGLAGEQIPIEARIIAVADALDALTSDRAHRSSLSLDGALETLRRSSGRQFDPNVVGAAHACLGLNVERLPDVSDTIDEALLLVAD